ncbi:MAG: hypothetical protein ACK4UN_17745, partial [Limisphaerales bacterium]
MEPRRSVHPPEAPADAQSNQAPAPQSSAGPQPIVVSPANLIATADTFVVANAETNPAAAFLLRNTTQSAGQLARNDKALLLRNAFIDTQSPEAIAIPERFRSKSDPGSYIVQSTGKLDERFRQQLASANAQVISYVPNNAYLVKVSGTGASQLAALP